MKYVLDKCSVFVSLFCVGNFRDILFTYRDIGYLGNLIKGIFSNLLKGIWDTFLFTSRDIGYRQPPIQGSILMHIQSSVK